MRLRLYSIVIVMILTLVVPAIFLRGTLPQKTATEIDGLAQLASMQGVSIGPTIWNETFDNITKWTLPSTNIPAILQVNNSLKLTIALPSTTSPQALSIYRNVNLPLDENPLMTLSLTVSQGVSYGIRFFGITANNTSFAAWREGSSLQHRPGLGVREPISVNLIAESSLANPKLSLVGATITRVLFYLEAAPLTSGNFALALFGLHANSIVATPATSTEVSGNFTGLVADMGPATTSQGLFQVFVGLDIKGSPDLSYTLYLTQGASVVAQAYTYAPKVTTTYELALLSPSLVNSAPLFTGKIGSSSLIVSSWAGKINFFRLDSVEIRFLSASAAPHPGLDPSNYTALMFYYFTFLFVIPVAMVILLVKVFKDEDEN
jgi:hypothetical protein